MSGTFRVRSEAYRGGDGYSVRDADAPASRRFKGKGKGGGLEGVADKHGLAVAVLGMDGRTTTARKVVVHAEKVVVDERVVVEHLYGKRSWQGRTGIAADGLAHREAEDRTKSFAAPEERISHRLDETGRDVLVREKT